MLFVVLGTMNNGHGIISVKVFLSQAELVIPNKDGHIAKRLNLDHCEW